MKKLAAVAVSIGVILVIIGLVIVGIYGRNSDGKIFSFATSRDFSSANASKTFQPDELQGLSKINIEVTYYSVYVEETDDEFATVDYVDLADEDVKVNIGIHDGVLDITQTGESYTHWNWTFFGISNNHFIVLKIPQTEQLAQTELKVKANYGAIRVEDLTFGKIDVNTDAGSITVEEVNASNVAIETSAGSLKIEDVEADAVSLISDAGSIKANQVNCNSMHAKTNAGSVKVTDCDVKGAINIAVDAGSVMCEAQCSYLTMRSNAGSIKFKSNASQIDLSSDTGSVKGTVLGAKSEYQIEVEHDMGSSNIENQTVTNTVKLLKVKVSMGSVKIDFEND